MRTLTKRPCSATTKRGEPCRARAVTQDGLCAMHGGLTDPRAMGQAGGRASVRSRLGISDEAADDNLRGLARRQLEGLLTSDNEQIRLRAASALYSYRAQQPPSEQPLASEGWKSYGGVSFSKLLETFVFDAEGAIDNELADVILRSAQRVRHLQAAGRLQPTFVDRELERAIDKFTDDIERHSQRRSEADLTA